MKQAIVMGIMTVLFMTVLTACENSAESDHSQEVQDMAANTMDAEYGQKDTEDDTLAGNLYTVDTPVFCKHFLDKIAKYFWTLLQNVFGHCCMSKLDKVAMPRLAA